MTPLTELVEQMEEAPPGTDIGDVVVVDIQRWKVHRVGTPVEALFRLHQMESVEDACEVVRDLKPLVAEDEKLAKAFLGVINDDVFRKMAREGEEAFRIKSLEDTTMLAQRVERIRDGLIEKGKREGLKKGERRGLRKGTRAGLRKGKREEAERLFLKLYTVKSGRTPADVRRRAGEATLEQLETWAASLLMVGRAEDVFDD